MGRKIKHYSSGYQIRRKKQRRVIESVVFGLLLVFLVFVGYAGARALNEMRLEQQTIESSVTQTESSLPESSDSSAEQSDLPSSDVSDESGDEESVSEAENASEVETLYTKYGDAERWYEPVKENLFTLYGTASAAYIPLPDIPKSADTEPLQAITMPLETALSSDAVASFLDGVDTTKYNAVVVPLKDSDGIIYYATGASLAYSCAAVSSQQVDLEAVINAIKSKGLKPVASIYSLHDHTAAHTTYGTSYFWMNDGSTTWLDAKVINGGQPWMNPYCSATIDYLTAIASELDQAGFVDLIVYGNQYPDSTLQQKLGLGETGGVSTTDQLQAVLEAMQQAAPGLRVVPAYQGACYTEGVNTQVYTATPNVFTFTPSAPIIGSDLSILDLVTAETSTLMPVIDSEEVIDGLTGRGITSYILQ